MTTSFVHHPVNNLDKAASFGQAAFAVCTSLVSVSLPVGCAVPAFMFSNCTSLTTVDNLDKAVSVGRAAFGACTALRSVTISSGFAGTGIMVFYSCQDLEITLLSPGVVSVDASSSNGTFFDATNITVYVPNTLLADYQADTAWQYWTDTIGNVTLAGISTQAAAFTTHPQDQAVTVGGSTSFTATASGDPAPTLQWQKSTDDGVS